MPCNTVRSKYIHLRLPIEMVRYHSDSDKFAEGGVKLLLSIRRAYIYLVAQGWKRTNFENSFKSEIRENQGILQPWTCVPMEANLENHKCTTKIILRTTFACHMRCFSEFLRLQSATVSSLIEWTLPEKKGISPPMRIISALRISAYEKSFE